MTKRVRFSQADIARVLRAAVKAGQQMMVEITPDGAIRIVQNEAPRSTRFDADKVVPL